MMDCCCMLNGIRCANKFYMFAEIRIDDDYEYVIPLCRSCFKRYGVKGEVKKR